MPLILEPAIEHDPDPIPSLIITIYCLKIHINSILLDFPSYHLPKDSSVRTVHTALGPLQN